MMGRVRSLLRKVAVGPRSVVDAARKARMRAAFAFQGQASSDYLESLVLGTAPFMACRLGTGELSSMIRYRLVAEGREPFQASRYEGLDKIAGFFPITEPMIRRYYERMLQDIKTIDVLGSWLKEESAFKKELESAKRCPLADLEPYYHARPWSAVLKGKKVLVIHPFEESIRRQYARRSELFDNKNVLPPFELLTFKAVQSLGSSHGRKQFSDWFAALRWMEDGVAALNFEVALIGCGAYGLPLAAHVKRLGKKAVHLGGATQILFGIIGQRWEGIPEVSRLFKESWLRPKEEERPDNFKEIEGGSYW